MMVVVVAVRCTDTVGPSLMAFSLLSRVAGLALLVRCRRKALGARVMLKSEVKVIVLPA